MKHDVAVCIPWRQTVDRVKAFCRVHDFWTHFGFPVYLGDPPGVEFNRSRARNCAVALADSETIIIADADTIPDIANVFAALDNSAGVTYVFDRYCHLAAETVDHTDLITAQTERVYTVSYAANFVCSSETYWDIGGFDERFIGGWGFEDSAFKMAAQTLSSVHRLPGTAFSFNHHEHRDMSRTNPNRARYDLYTFAANRPDVMKELVRQ